MQTSRENDRCAEMLKILGEPLRLRILSDLSGGPRTVAEVASALGIPHYQASRHLSALACIGVVRQTKLGRIVRCELASAAPVVDLGCCTLRLEPAAQQQPVCGEERCLAEIVGPQSKTP